VLILQPKIFGKTELESGDFYGIFYQVTTDCI